MGKKKTVVVDADTSPTDPLYDASHPDESTKIKKKGRELKADSSLC